MMYFRRSAQVVSHPFIWVSVDNNVLTVAFRADTVVAGKIACHLWIVRLDYTAVPAVPLHLDTRALSGDQLGQKIMSLPSVLDLMRLAFRPDS
jgi:hypothetical protein